MTTTCMSVRAPCVCACAPPLPRRQLAADERVVFDEGGMNRGGAAGLERLGGGARARDAAGAVPGPPAPAARTPRARPHRRRRLRLTARPLGPGRSSPPPPPPP